MTSDRDSNEPQEDMAGQPEILSEYDRIQRELSQGYDGDPRLESGVPPEQRGSDIEFIQMSGLVKPSPVPPDSPASPEPLDLDTTRPVSFFERGVADVDADMVPGTVEDPHTAREEIEPVEPTRSPMAHLREMIADLTREPVVPAPDPTLMAQLESPTSEAPPAPRPEPPEPTPPVPVVSAAVTDHPAPSMEPEPAPVVEPKSEPIALEDVLAECAPIHPMQHEAAASETAVEIASDEPTPPVMDFPREPAAVTVASEPAAHGADKPFPVDDESTRRPAPVLREHTAHLAEAEKLLEELAPEPAFARAPATEPVEPETSHDIPEPASEAEDIPDEALDFKKSQGRRRHRSVSKFRLGRTLKRLAALFLIFVGVAAAGYTAYLWVLHRMASPTQLYNQAGKLMTRGEYREAAALFEKFAALHPNHPLRGEAQFAAAFAVQLQRPNDADEAQEITKESLRLFEQFRRENPTHSKVARAETLMGRLHYEAGHYREAVELLRNPELRLRDPASAVPALRTLARASAKMGDAEAARSYYLQSVGVQDNHSPDVDYAELGTLYQSLAERTEDLDKRIRLQQLAIESWTHALEVPSIDPSSKQTIRSQLDVLRERLQNEPGMSPAMESLDDSASEETGVFVVGAHDGAAPVPAAPEPSVPPTADAPAVPTPAPETDAAPVGDTPQAEAPPAESVPAPEAAPATEPALAEYVVKQGDTLTAIARAHSTTVEALVELNALSSDMVFVGQHLLVPAAAPVATKETAE